MKKVVFTLMLLCLGRYGYTHSTHSLALSELVYQIRNPKTGLEPFRNAVEKIGEYLSLQVLEDLPMQRVEIQTVTGGTASHLLSAETPVLITILRAGLPLCLGAQKVFPHSEVGYLGMSRNEETLQAKLEYIALPDVKNKLVVVTDTMLATAGTMLHAIRILEKRGAREIYIVTAIASATAIARVFDHNPKIKVYAAAIDSKLNEHGFIIPGLGDAGDRSYGKKN